MAKTPLRVYNRDIETLVERGQISEAVAHCQHILKIFPKCIDTYRLLGKAYLEVHRYSEAADVFQRLLLAVPEDFIANLGMSIIYDEQKSVDAAIWHMERAFEVQPSNTAVQGELKRLYARRDGMEPPKIRLTRGALAQMYARGEQYTQAVAEIKALLEEEPQRLDLQVLLARVYFKAGQKVEATEMCATLIKRYPYSFDANRIMVEILPGTGRADTVQSYRQRVNALDPYAAYAAGSIFASAEVPDQTVVIERYEYREEDFPQPDYGLQPQAGAENPAWLTGAVVAEEVVDAATPANEDEIPAWLKQAGWGESTPDAVAQAERAASLDFAAGQEDAVPGEISQGEMPDWLKSIAPPGALDKAADLSAGSQDSEEDMKWFESLGVPSSNKSEEDDHTLVGMAGLAALGKLASDKFSEDEEEQLPAATEEPTPVAEAVEDVPDWLTEGQPADLSGEAIPDWLSGLGAEGEKEPEVPVGGVAALAGLTAASMITPEEHPENINEAQEEGEPTPGWLSGEQAESETPAVEGETPDWLTALADDNETPGASAGEIEGVEGLAADAGELPDWLSNEEIELDSGQPSGQVETPAQPAANVDEDDTFAWLESLAAKQGANPEELLTKPEDRPEETPDWLEQFGEGATPVVAAGIAAVGVAAAAASEDEEPVQEQEPQVSLDEPVIQEAVPVEAEVQAQPAPEMTEDDAFAWLEALAAKQGANPEELLTKPEDRPDEAPDWLGQLGDNAAPVAVAGITAAGVAAAVSSDEEPSEEAQADLEEKTALEAPADIETHPQSVPEMSEDDAFAWLESLAAKQGANPEELLTKPEDRPEGTPDWLEQIVEEEQLTGTPVPELDETHEPVQEESTPVEVPLVEETQTAQVLDEMSDQDTFAWLESLAAKQGANPEELLTKPEDRPEETPDWVEKINADAAVAAAGIAAIASHPEEQELPLEAQQDAVQPESMVSEDDAFAWLESLAARQGANPEELLTKPEERPEDTPEWIERMGGEASQSFAEDGGWMAELAVPEATEAAEAEPAPEVEVAPSGAEVPAQDVSDWLQSLDRLEQPEESQAEVIDAISQLQVEAPLQSADEELPGWLRSEPAEEEPEPEPEPAQPVETLQWQLEEPEVETPSEPAAAVRVARVAAGAPEKEVAIFEQAQGELQDGNLDAAMQSYAKLIKKGKMLDETIFDLRESLYRHPVDVIIWQTLGDAYMRANRLQDALDAYTKAEELLR